MSQRKTALPLSPVSILEQTDYVLIMICLNFFIVTKLDRLDIDGCIIFLDDCLPSTCDSVLKHEWIQLEFSRGPCRRHFYYVLEAPFSHLVVYYYYLSNKATIYFLKLRIQF